MIASLRESKTRLSELVNRASDGEEILITVHGEPRARLVPVTAANPEITDWMRELADLRATQRTKVSRSIRGALDETREDRW